MLSKLKKVKQHPGGSKSGIMGNLVTTAEYAGASYLYGWGASVKPRVFGMPTSLATGVALKVVSLGCGIVGGVAAKACPHLDVVGNAGIGAYALALGASHGAGSSGSTRLELPKGYDAKRAQTLIPGSVVLGAIAPAPQGDLLSANDLMNLAKRR